MKKNTERDSKIVEMYNEGITYREISEYFGFKNNTPMVLNALKRNGIITGNGRYPKRTKGAKEIDLEFFEKIDSKEKAYVLGLIYSDGSLDRDGYGFSFVSKDYELISLFKKTIKSEHKICEIKSHDSRTDKIYTRFSIHICSKKITKDLLNLGLSNSKSFSCNYPEIPKKLIWHFIRGLFDGDGCITNTGKVGKLSFSIILSGELKNGIKEYFNSCGMKNTKDQLKHKNVEGEIWSLKYSSYEDLKFIFDNMYLDSVNLRLSRKYDLFHTLKQYKLGDYPRKSKKVYQYDLDGNLIKIFENTNFVDGNFTRSKIYQSIRSGKKYKGFLFSNELKTNPIKPI